MSLAAELAALAASRPRPLLLGLDLDGTLAPIVAHPDLAQLSPGARDALQRLDACSDVALAVVSGRSFADLGRFAFPASTRVVGSHGLEDGNPLVLDAAETRRLGQVRIVAREAADRAQGAWVEQKPAGVVLHVRKASEEDGAAALAWFGRQLEALPAVQVRPSHQALEASVRPGTKAAAIGRLRHTTGAKTVLYAGDDVTDEDVFVALGPHDLGIKVGEGPTVAKHRLHGPEDVVVLLAGLVKELGA